MSQKKLSLCVYCGSRPGQDPAFVAAAQAVGREIGRRGWQLVYGGGHVGLMGTVADATLAAGGQAVGIIPRKLMDREVGHRGLTELVVVETMHERKRIMAERADAFIALPGGIGTMEELFEVWTWRQIGYHDQPVGLLNVSGYYDALLSFLHTMTDAGFLGEAQRQVLCTDDDAGRLLDRLASQALRARGQDDYSQI
jgi:uncharacterized protein (TIGR00730 family)